MSIGCPVATCGRQMPGDTAICPVCSGELARRLGDVPWLSAHLTVTLTRQAHVDAGGRRGEPEAAERQVPGTLRPTPLPYDLRASEAAAQLRTTVAAWARALTGGQPVLEGPACAACRHLSCARVKLDRRAADDTAACARWLLAELHRLERHEAAAEIVADVAYAVTVAERAIDRPAATWYAGPCEACGRDLYAEPGATLVQCTGCRNAYGVAGRRDHLLAAAEDTLATATVAARALTSLGQRLTPERVWKWAERGRITAHGVDALGHPQYRIGDLRQLLGEAERKAAERREGMS